MKKLEFISKTGKYYTMDYNMDGEPMVIELTNKGQNGKAICTFHCGGQDNVNLQTVEKMAKKYIADHNTMVEMKEREIINKIHN